MHVAKNKSGLILGVFFSLLHILWSVLVATGAAQTVLDWIFKMHFLSNPYEMQPFDAVNAVILVVLTFVVGYIVGWLFGLFVHALHKK